MSFNPLKIFLTSFGDKILMSDLTMSCKVDWPKGTIKVCVDNAGYAVKSGLGKVFKQKNLVFDLDETARLYTEAEAIKHLTDEAYKVRDELMKEAHE